MEGTIGTIMLFAGNFAPKGWAFCQGQILPIAQNTALFSILGTTYGGNGQTTFALPDLRGRAPLGQGQGPGLQSITLGEVSGVENVTLLSSQMPIHSHTVFASQNATTTNPGGGFPANDARGTPVSIYAETTDQTAMNNGMIGPAGGSQPVPIRNPYLGLNYVICLFGIFPSRN